MLCLKQRDGRRTNGSDKVAYQEVRNKPGGNVTWKPIKVPAVTPHGDSWSKNEIPPHDDRLA